MRKVLIGSGLLCFFFFLSLKGGGGFSIKAEKVSEENIYIQGVSLNGEDFCRISISYEEVLQGGELKFLMSPDLNRNWGISKNSKH